MFQVIQAVTFWPPLFGGHDSPLISGHVFFPHPQKGHGIRRIARIKFSIPTAGTKLMQNDRPFTRMGARPVKLQLLPPQQKILWEHRTACERASRWREALGIFGHTACNWDFPDLNQSWKERRVIGIISLWVSGELHCNESLEGRRRTKKHTHTHTEKATLMTTFDEVRWDRRQTLLFLLQLLLLVRNPPGSVFFLFWKDLHPTNRADENGRKL